MSSDLIQNIYSRFAELESKSSYKSDFNKDLYKTKFFENPYNGEPFFISSMQDCSECFYGLQIDSYGNGCVHNCEYCWAKRELSAIDKWNNPSPSPIDISEFWYVFYDVLEKKNTQNKFYDVISKRMPIRVGALSDPFMLLDKKFGVTLELIKILMHYEYPVLFLTRSSLVSDDTYLKVMDKRFCSIQISLPSLNEKFVSKLEPGACSVEKRLETLKKLTANKFHVVVRLNPLFPQYKDGELSKRTPSPVPFNDFFDFNDIQKLKDAGCRFLLVGFAHADEQTINIIKEKMGVDLRDGMCEEYRNKFSYFKYTGQEMSLYYKRIKELCNQLEIEFTTCYLGLGESLYWKDQVLWSNKSDCCNVIGRVEAFNKSTKDISFYNRIKIEFPKSNFFFKFKNTVLFYLKRILLKELFKGRK